MGIDEELLDPRTAAGIDNDFVEVTVCDFAWARTTSVVVMTECNGELLETETEDVRVTENEGISSAAMRTNCEAVAAD